MQNPLRTASRFALRIADAIARFEYRIYCKLPRLMRLPLWLLMPVSVAEWLYGTYQIFWLLNLHLHINGFVWPPALLVAILLYRLVVVPLEFFILWRFIQLVRRGPEAPQPAT